MTDYQARWAAMSPQERTATLDAVHGFSTKEWALFQCSDCNPEFMDEDDEHHGEWDGPFQMVCVKDERPDYCPRCLSYLSLDSPGTATVVHITTVTEGP